MILPAEDAGAVTLPLFSGRLTRALLFRLPAGRHLVCNVWPNGVPAFSEPVGPESDRAAQWQRVKDASVDGQVFHVFETSNDAIDWVTARHAQFSKSA